MCSAESLVWPGKDGYETPALFKAAADKLLVAGVTRLVHHGFAAQPPVAADEFGALGWHPFSGPYSGAGTYSSLLGALDGDVLAGLNAYVARVQASLTQGRPDADVLVLYPWLGFPASWTRLTGRDELLFNGRFHPDDPDPSSSGAMAAVTQVFGEPVLGPRGEWIEAVEPLLDGLHAAGYAWDWVNEERLRAAVAEDGRVRVGDVTWKAVLLVDAPWLEPQTARHLADLAQAGVPVAVVGALPVRQPGLGDAEAGDAEVADAMATLLTGTRARQIAPADLVADLEGTLGVPPGLRFWPDAGGVRHLRRALPAGELVFFSNPSRASVATAVTVPAGCEQPAWLDPLAATEAGAMRVTEAAPDADGRLALHLDAHGSVLLHCGDLPADVVRAAAPEAAAVLPVAGWSVAAGADGAAQALDALPDLRDRADLVGGAVLYTATVDVPAALAGAPFALDLGWVDGALVQVEVGGVVDVLGASLPPFRAAFASGAGGTLQAGQNPITVKVVPPFANVVRTTDDPQAARYAERPLAPFGLRGPVTLTLFTKAD